MIKYFSELENRSEYYIPLINKTDDGKTMISERTLSLSFIQSNYKLFSIMNDYIEKFRHFNLNSWCRSQIFITNEDFEKLEDISSEYEVIREEFDYVLEDYSKINISSHELLNFIDLSKSICSLFYDINGKEEDLLILNDIKNAINDLKNYITITYSKNNTDNLYQPDFWYITPNNYLYNVGLYKNNNGEFEGHKSRDISKAYRRMIYQIKEEGMMLNNYELSTKYFGISKEIENRNYVTSDQFSDYLNYISQPNYISVLNGDPITYEKNTIDIILGIVNAHGCFYRFYEELFMYTNNPKEEIEKINNLTKNDIKDILVRCCGFHKVESMVKKTITTSTINYEEEFEEYVKNGWSINFVPPIIINKEKRTVEEYPEEFLLIRKLLKK